MSFQSDLIQKLKIEIGPSAPALVKKCMQQLKKDPSVITQSDIQEIAHWAYTEVRRITDEPTALRVRYTVISMKPTSMKIPFSTSFTTKQWEVPAAVTPSGLQAPPPAADQIPKEDTPELKDVLKKILANQEAPKSPAVTPQPAADIENNAGPATIPGINPFSVQEKFTTPEMWSSYGDSCMKLGKYNDADAAYAKALKLRPDDPGIWLKRANLKFEKEKTVLKPELKNQLSKIMAERGTLKPPAKIPSPAEDTTIQPPVQPPVVKQPPVQQPLVMQLSVQQLFRQPVSDNIRDLTGSLPATGDPPAKEANFSVTESGPVPGLADDTPGYTVDEEVPANTPGIKTLTLNERIEDCLGRLETDNTSTELWTEVADLYTRVGKFREASQAYLQIVELGVSTPEIWNSYGDSCKKLGQYDDADEAYARVLELRPDDPEVWLKRAKVQTSRNRYTDALASCDRSLEFDNTALVTWHYKAFVLKKARRLEEALDVYKHIRQIYPGDDNAERQIMAIKNQLKK